MSVTHLLFADDSLIFTRATKEDCNELKSLFQTYALASCQIFNYEKSSLMFSLNSKNCAVEFINGIFQMSTTTPHDKYLGLLSMISRNKKSLFNEKKNRIVNKLKS